MSKQYTEEFKATVALEAVKGEMSVPAWRDAISSTPWGILKYQ